MAIGSILYVLSSVFLVLSYDKLYDSTQSGNSSADRFQETLILQIVCIYLSFVQQLILLATVIKRVSNNDANITKTQFTLSQCQECA